MRMPELLVGTLLRVMVSQTHREGTPHPPITVSMSSFANMWDIKGADLPRSMSWHVMELQSSSGWQPLGGPPCRADCICYITAWTCIQRMDVPLILGPVQATYLTLCPRWAPPRGVPSLQVIVHSSQRGIWGCPCA